MRFFEEGFEPVLELDAITGQLISASHARPPEPLLGVEDKTEREFLRDEALLTKRSASGKSFFRPPTPRFD